ncbi:MAG: nicotinamide-nucleotide adenylyltransferase [Nanoarchaeota archaeon]|nr:nicotinamide-nucleotide adenylyltransferase [Nanoarchaeota archaeon]
MTIKQGCICGRDIAGGETIKFLCGSCNLLYDLKMIGLYIGRFQPFHKGHLEVVKSALKEAKHLIIVIAVPLKKIDKDPFSADERKEMIEKVLKDERISNFSLYIVPDIPSDEEYVAHIRNHVPNFNVVYVGDNKLNERLFKEAGFKVINSRRYYNISSTKVREDMLKQGNAWKKVVPNAVVEYIERKHLEKKVKA